MNIQIPSDSIALNVYVRNHEPTTYDVIVSEEQKQNNTVFSFLDGTYSEGILTIDIPYRTQEQRFYWIRIYSNSVEIYKGKVYCTNQTDLEKYDPTNDYFKQIEKPDTVYIVKGEYQQGDSSENAIQTENSQSLYTEDNQEILIEY